MAEPRQGVRPAREEEDIRKRERRRAGTRPGPREEPRGRRHQVGQEEEAEAESCPEDAGMAAGEGEDGPREAAVDGLAQQSAPLPVESEVLQPIRGPRVEQGPGEPFRVDRGEGHRMRADDRQPFGRHAGGLAKVRPDDLLGAVIQEVVGRSGFKADQIDDVTVGCTNQAGEDARNVARHALLLAGLPIEIPGSVTNRLCGSGLNALIHASHAITCKEATVAVIGGVAVNPLLFLIALLAIRNYKLREKYAVLWLATAGMITLAAIFPQLMDLAREWFGMQYITSVVTVVFLFLVLVAFHFSIALSALNDKAAATASRFALLEARIREMEQKQAARAGCADERGTSAGTYRAV